MTTPIHNTGLTATAFTEALPVLNIALAQICRRIPAHVSREDLASAAKLALISALRQVRGSQAEVNAYCYTRVRGAILDELRRLDPLSRRARAKVNLIESAASSLAQRCGREATAEEIADAAGVDLEHVLAARRLVEASRLLSLDETDDTGSPRRDYADTEADCPRREAGDNDAGEALRRAITRLPPTQARVLQRYYFEDATLDEIAAELGVTKERVRQIREAAQQKLRSDAEICCLA
jgi:RNA polymerase sigma factor for flagellar operon FliA